MKELIQIQSELKAPKNQRNSFGGYNYRSAEDILEAVKPLCAGLGCVLTLNDDIVLVGDRYYVKATATIASSDDKSVSVSAFAREELTKKGQDASQITGATSSYARKYALNGLFCIDDTQDSDDVNDHGKGNSAPATGDNRKTAAPKKAPVPPKEDEVSKDLAEAKKALSLCKDGASIDEVVRVFKTLWKNEEFKGIVASRRKEIAND